MKIFEKYRYIKTTPIFSNSGKSLYRVFNILYINMSEFTENEKVNAEMVR
jgi:hypothetical protein